MTINPPSLLLDTCAVIWLVHGHKMKSAATDAIMLAGRSSGAFVSVVSAWEIGLIANPPKGPAAIDFLPDPKSWFARLMAQPGIRRADLTEDIAIDSASLPGAFHRDPADRLIVATARSLEIPIVTSDRKILDYAKAGYVSAIPC